MGQITIDGNEIETSFGARWDESYRGAKWPLRRDPIIGIVLHETAGANAASALNAWRSHVVGAEFVVDLDGTVWQCADPSRQSPWHAGPWSPGHIGIEVVCPVTSRSPYGKPQGGAWGEPWASAPRVELAAPSPFVNLPSYLGHGLYVPPLRPQLATLVDLVNALRSAYEDQWQIIDAMAWKLADATPRRGIVAHGQTTGQRIDGYGPLAALQVNDAGASSKFLPVLPPELLS